MLQNVGFPVVKYFVPQPSFFLSFFLCGKATNRIRGSVEAEQSATKDRLSWMQIRFQFCSRGQKDLFDRFQ